MNYEKAYKAALEWMRDVYPTLTGAAKEDAEHFFPELKESEDERIRKEILGFIQLCLSRTDFGSRSIALRKEDAEMFEKWIAYLEKQNDVPSRKTTLGIWKLGNFWKENQEERDGLTQLQYIQKYLCLGFKNATIDYLKEQKPTDDKDFEEWLDDWYQGSKELGGDIVMSEAEFKNWSRGIRNMYQQKPTEWSEEDKNKLYQVMETLIADKTIAQRNYPRCKALHKAYDELITWLKSLRPQSHWKPGKEQMGSLRLAIDSAKKAQMNATADSLNEIYEQLKKL